jgi:hypothetical protein
MLAVLSACTQIQPAAPSVDTAPRTEVKAASGPVLYVSAHFTSGGGEVYMLSYPQGQLLGTLTGVSRPPLDLCADKAGNVWVTTIRLGRYAPLYEFAHGATTPTKMLNDPGDPGSCSVDPTTGDVAVANYDNPYSGRGAGNVAIFHKGRPPAKIYTDKDIQSFGSCSYDDRGGLLVAAEDNLDQNVLAALAPGGKSFSELTLDKTLSTLGPVQWDGRYFAVGYRSPRTVFQVAVSGSAAKVVKVIRLIYQHNKIDGQFWIQRKTIVAIVGPLERGNSAIGFWQYPTGGKATQLVRRLSANMYLTGLTVSVAR